jgi:xanthine dehydrogenase accessory factor
MPSDAEVLFEQAAAWQAQGHGVALATVVKTWGSSPRPPGSLLLVNDRGAMVGSVSGGCIEGAVVQAALSTIADGTARLLEFGVTSEMAWEVGLACGGQVHVLLATLGGAAAGERLLTLLADLKARRPVVLLTTLPTGEQQLCHPKADAAAAAGESAVIQAARTALSLDRCSEVMGEGEARLFVQPFCPPVRVVIVGAVHIAQPLSQMAALAGLEVILIDPRKAFATSERFPGVTLHASWPGPVLETLTLDARSAVITLTHDPKLDDPALVAALNSPAFYIGALGSGKTHAARLRRLQARGFDEAALARVHGPVGLPLGARSPAEIAVSILAQLVAELRREPS